MFVSVGSFFSCNLMYYMTNVLYFYIYFFACSGSHTDELPKLWTHLPSNPDQLAFDAQMRQTHSQRLSLDDLDVTPEKEGIILCYIRYCAFIMCEYLFMCLIFLGKSTDSEGLDVSSSVSHGNICTPETVFMAV